MIMHMHTHRMHRPQCRRHPQCWDSQGTVFAQRGQKCLQEVFCAGPIYGPDPTSRTDWRPKRVFPDMISLFYGFEFMQFCHKT